MSLKIKIRSVWFQVKQVMSDFQPLEFVCRGSEKQPQVSENLNY